MTFSALYKYVSKLQHSPHPTHPPQKKKKGFEITQCSEKHLKQKTRGQTPICSQLGVKSLRRAADRDKHQQHTCTLSGEVSKHPVFAVTLSLNNLLCPV